MHKPDLIYCAAASRRYATIARRHGFFYGAQLPGKVYYSPYFVDQNWKKPDKIAYIQAIKKHRPHIATVLDLEHEHQLPEVLQWAAEIAPFVRTAIVIIPKVFGVISKLPKSIKDVPIRLGYSVPTSYGATQVPLWEFGDWPVHLLGGSPHKQYELAQYLNVVSADSNYVMLLANRCQFFVNGTARYAHDRFFPSLQEAVNFVDKDANYQAFELSCMNIKAMWAGCKATIRYALASDIANIRKIEQQTGNISAVLNDITIAHGIAAKQLLVAEYGHNVVGFCLFAREASGEYIIRTVFVHNQHLGEHIDMAFQEAIPKFESLYVKG